MILTQLNMLGALEEMSVFEKNEYFKRPTSINAVLVPIKYKIKLENAKLMKIKYENVDCVVYYEI